MPTSPLPLSELMALAVFFTSICIGAGPNNALLLRSGLCFGFQKTLPHILGGNIGTVILFILSYIGLVQFLKIDWIAHGLMLISSFYLIYLAIQIALSNPTHPLQSQPANPLNFWQAFGLVFINPTAWTLVMGLLLTYLPKANPNQQYFAFILMVSLFFIIGLSCSSLWTLGGKTLEKLLKQPKQIRIMNLVIAGFMLVTVSHGLFSYFRHQS